MSLDVSKIIAAARKYADNQGNQNGKLDPEEFEFFRSELADAELTLADAEKAYENGLISAREFKEVKAFLTELSGGPVQVGDKLDASEMVEDSDKVEDKTEAKQEAEVEAKFDKNYTLGFEVLKYALDKGIVAASLVQNADENAEQKGTNNLLIEHLKETLPDDKDARSFIAAVSKVLNGEEVSHTSLTKTQMKMIEKLTDKKPQEQKSFEVAITKRFHDKVQEAIKANQHPIVAEDIINVVFNEYKADYPDEKVKNQEAFLNEQFLYYHQELKQYMDIYF